MNLGELYNNASYSVILYTAEIKINLIEQLEKLVKSNGIVVHLLINEHTSDNIDESGMGKAINIFKESKIMSNALDKKMLHLYQVNINKDNYIEDQVIAYDSIILNTEFYNNICSSKYCEFNNEQYNIVNAPADNNIIVISGAGTGKTTTMVNRLVYLMKSQKFSLKDTALITFTNDAANEMRSRLISLLNDYYDVTKNTDYLNMMEDVSECMIGTIHSFAKHIINSFKKSIEIKKEISITTFKYLRRKSITEAINYIYENKPELHKLIEAYPIYEVENKFLKVWDMLDNHSIELNFKGYKVDFGEENSDFEELIKLILTYANEVLDKEKDGYLEVSDLIKKLGDERLLDNIDTGFKLVMVDEFQDSDNIQIDFISKYCMKTNANLFVVGDEKQSIYRFRGAEYTAFQVLQEKLKDSSKSLSKFTMVKNYRTDSNLLSDINDRFVNINKRVSKFTYNKEDEIFSTINLYEDNEIEFINLEDELILKNFIMKLREDKKANETIAVLTRSNNDAEKFKHICDKYSIPCRINTEGGFYRHKAIRDLYIMLESLISSNDNNIDYAFLSSPYNEKLINKKVILDSCSNKNTREVLDNTLEEINWKNKRKKLLISNPIVLIEEIIREYNPVKNCYKRQLAVAKKDIKDYKEVAYLNACEYKINLEHAIFTLKNKFANKVATIYQVSEFLKYKIATDNDEDVKLLSKEQEDNFIKCMTVHKAKGLEFDHVYLFDLTHQFIRSRDVEVIVKEENKIFKIGTKLQLGDREFRNSYYSKFVYDENKEIIGEEARLLYVAFTRCKKRLILNTKGVGGSKINNWNSLLIGGAEGV